MKDNKTTAFPVNGVRGPECTTGMSLRDYFAAKAMQALFDSDAGHLSTECQMIAEESYVMADAML